MRHENPESTDRTTFAPKLGQDQNPPGQFDYGLSPEEEGRAQKLHRESVVFDLVSQHAGSSIFAYYPPALQIDLQNRLQAEKDAARAFIEALFWPYEMSKLGKSDLLFEWCRASGLTCGMYGIDVVDGGERPTTEWEVRVNRYRDLPWLRYVTSAEEIRQAKKDGVIAFYGNCQPTVPIPRNFRAIDLAYARGLRSLMLTYNLMDHVGVGCTERVDAGLSRFGVDVVGHCNQLGVMVDVSHCGHLTTMDACRHSRKPVNANHTAAYSLYPHARGKRDEALKAIADTGGVVGVVALPAYLTADPAPSMEQMLDHIDYIAQLVGWQHVAIGTDWPLQAPESVLRPLLSPQNTVLGFRDEDRLDVSQRLRGFDDCRDWPNITRGLIKRGYSDVQAQGILGENALRVFAEVCG